MALPTSTAAPRHRSAAERLSIKLGGETRFREFLARFADALEAGGKTVVFADSVPGDTPLQQAPFVLAGKRAWS